MLLSPANQALTCAMSVTKHLVKRQVLKLRKKSNQKKKIKIIKTKKKIKIRIRIKML